MVLLPYAPPGYRWIRYYDDALLVDTWDGTVVDAEPLPLLVDRAIALVEGALPLPAARPLSIYDAKSPS